MKGNSVISFNVLMFVLLLIVSNASLASTKPLTFQWTEIDFADAYRLEYSKDNGNSWNHLPLTQATTLAVESTEKGDVFRVIACINVPPSMQTQCEEVAQYSDEYTVTHLSNERRVIFMHTDLLGSPVAMSDEFGNAIK
ncbi:hypothetical protein OE749_17575 [Aestuariibacter sp. AA17]|uniref:Uncharacterized protein n=1 Tax=Fluctibacter corallii TaxID=2984329 RepID=A0ABT3ACY1_9ALTE|nr:hypothetical protein [Aestuariibacter sp. AA17]MCV2886510.1 hypothetical protein [Aestuariibacter sp. AA17]